MSEAASSRPDIVGEGEVGFIVDFDELTGGKSDPVVALAGGGAEGKFEEVAPTIVVRIVVRAREGAFGG